MIRALRVRHRAILAALALVVPAAFAAALLGRAAPPPPSPWPADGAPPAPAGDPRIVMWSTQDLLTELRHGDDGTLHVRALSWSENTAPALALYWCPAGPSHGALPEGARFVGALGSTCAAPRVLTLRDAPAGGWLALYSLGHGEVLGALELGNP